MEKRQKKWSVTLLGGTLLFLGAALKATTTFSELEADVYLPCSENAMCVVFEFSIGDFDGDRFNDLIFPLHDSSPVTDLIVFGDHFPAGGSVPALRTTRIESFNSGFVPMVNIGDITGDGRADIFHFRTLFNSGFPCDVTLGRPGPPATMSPPANFAISGGAVGHVDSIAFGDVNGDGLKDLLFYYGTAYVVFGSMSFQNFTSNLSVTDTAHVMKILGGGRGSIASGDVDGDGYDDILLGDPKDLTQPGVVYVIRGSTSLPSVWDLGTRSADWTIYGEGVKPLNVKFATDLTGDGKADLGLESEDGDDIIPKLLSGATLLAIGPIAKLTPGFSNSLTPMDMSESGSPLSWFPSKLSDFDGDGRADLYAINYSSGGYEVDLFLSHSFPAGSALPEVAPPPDIRFTGASRGMEMGDLNGDGKSDLIYFSRMSPRLNVFYGYRPLENPSIVVQSREPNQARVHLTFSVEGEPAEMKLTGNILDPAPGVWIPFQQKVDVTLTPEVGEKTITAVFRTSGKRESDSVSATVPLALGEAGASVVTNLLREGGTARFEVRLDTAGRLKASVYSREGRILRTLVDGDVSSGVHVIEWDGTNGDGDRVAPGIYTVVVDRAGSIDRRRVLVK